MTDREALIRGVLAQPQGIAERMVYADWLQENRLDAQAELMRLACKPPAAPGKRHSKAYYDWLKENWKSLIPSLAACNVQPPEDYPEPMPPFEERVIVDTYRISMTVSLPGRLQFGRVRYYPCGVKLFAFYGWVFEWEVRSEWARGQLLPALFADCPQLKVKEVIWAEEESKRMAENATADLSPGETP